MELDANNRLNIVDGAGNTTGLTVSDPAINEVTTVTEFQDPDSQAPTLQEFAADGADTSSQTSK